MTSAVLSQKKSKCLIYFDLTEFILFYFIFNFISFYFNSFQFNWIGLDWIRLGWIGFGNEDKLIKMQEDDAISFLIINKPFCSYT